ncbi:gas vesicle protein GvpJ [Rhodococcus sp. JVH1]|uniref:gas vesicle protein GvpJ n=1 Tax=Rhodococcus sp. JVH1 TaxID=745408 RepID=UPI000272121A|nr:gas vesicle protein GvpJ [Rhodococcus sp. JVH1]EJJ01396.1 gas vesicle structural protein [Rhodococcus sp. JVH1]
MTTAGGPSSSSLADVIDTILDKGLVIDAYVRVSLVGIELLTIDARVVVASVDTYLRFAEAVNRLEIGSEPKGLSEIVSGATEGGAKSKTKGALESAGDKLGGLLGGGEEEEEPERERVSRKSTRGDDR